MRLLHKPDARSDRLMGNTAPKTKESNHRGSRSPSPLGSLKQFGSHLSTVIGLNDLHHRHHASHLRRDEVLFTSFQPHSEVSRHGPRSSHQKNEWDPGTSSGTNCQPGPSTPWIPRRMKAAPTIANFEEARTEQREFTEIHEWRREEIKLMINVNGQRFELDFLPEDSPLKGKEAARWRVKISQMESHGPKQEPASLFLPPPEKSFQRSEKAFQGWAVRNQVQTSQQPLHRRSETHNNKAIDTHNKATEIRLHDSGKDMILRIEPRAKLRKLK